jgi:hypothetical protein
MLTARGAFVLQVDDAADPDGGRFGGRVEHLVSGKAVDFQSSGALLAFIAEALRSPVAPTDKDPG